MDGEARTPLGDRLTRRLLDRTKRRPRLGFAPAFYARLGEEDPWAPPPALAADGGGDEGFVYLSAAPYYAMLRRLALARRRRERRTTSFLERRAGTRMRAASRRFPGEAGLARQARPLVSELVLPPPAAAATTTPEPGLAVPPEARAREAWRGSAVVRGADAFFSRPALPGAAASRPAALQVAGGRVARASAESSPLVEALERALPVARRREARRLAAQVLELPAAEQAVELRRVLRATPRVQVAPEPTPAPPARPRRAAAALAVLASGAADHAAAHALAGTVEDARRPRDVVRARAVHRVAERAAPARAPASVVPRPVRAVRRAEPTPPPAPLVELLRELQVAGRRDVVRRILVEREPELVETWDARGPVSARAVGPAIRHAPQGMTHGIPAETDARADAPRAPRGMTHGTPAVAEARADAPRAPLPLGPPGPGDRAVGAPRVDPAAVRGPGARLAPGAARPDEPEPAPDEVLEPGFGRRHRPPASLRAAARLDEPPTTGLLPRAVSPTRLRAADLVPVAFVPAEPAPTAGEPGRPGAAWVSAPRRTGAEAWASAPERPETARERSGAAARPLAPTGPEAPSRSATTPGSAAPPRPTTASPSQPPPGLGGGPPVGDAPRSPRARPSPLRRAAARLEAGRESERAVAAYARGDRAEPALAPPPRSTARAVATLRADATGAPSGPDAATLDGPRRSPPPAAWHRDPPVAGPPGPPPVSSGPGARPGPGRGPAAPSQSPFAARFLGENGASPPSGAPATARGETRRPTRLAPVPVLPGPVAAAPTGALRPSAQEWAEARAEVARVVSHAAPTALAPVAAALARLVPAFAPVEPGAPSRRGGPVDVARALRELASVTERILPAVAPPRASSRGEPSRPGHGPAGRAPGRSPAAPAAPTTQGPLAGLVRSAPTAWALGRAATATTPPPRPTAPAVAWVRAEDRRVAVPVGLFSAAGGAPPDTRDTSHVAPGATRAAGASAPEAILPRHSLSHRLAEVDSASPRADAAWAARASGALKVRSSGGLFDDLARATTAEQVVRTLFNRADGLRDLPEPVQAPVRQVVQQIREEVRQARAEPEPRVSRPAAPTAEPLRARGATRPPSEVRVTHVRTAEPARTPASRGGGSADKVMKLVQKLESLIHLAEVERRLAEARRQVRMAEDSAHARAEGGHGQGPDAAPGQGDGAEIDIEQLGREVLEVVARELELRRERRMEDHDESHWW